MQRSGGRSTVWVNGEAIPEGAQADGAVSPAAIRAASRCPLGESAQRYDLRVGESLDRGSGEVRDVIGEGEIKIGPRRAARKK